VSILEGLHVVEISASGAAAMAAKHLADWGARVTILEPAGGTPLRDAPPYYEIDGARRSATWAWLSRGKTAASLSAADACALCESADVVLAESELTEAVLGLAPGGVRAGFEGRTTFVLVSPFATDGPYASYAASDLGLNALGGWMALLGDADREPLRPAAGSGDLTPRLTGLYGLVAALIGLRHVRNGGEPQFVDLSAQAVAASMLVAPWLVKSLVSFQHQRRGNTWPMGVMECADGYIGCPPLTNAHWELLCQMMGIEDVLENPHGRDIGWRMQHGAELHERVRPWLEARTRSEVVELAQAFRLPAAPVQTIADRLACPQLEARGFWRTAEIAGGEVRVPRVAYSIGGVEPVERGPLREAEAIEVPARRAAGGSGASKLPFEGLRVLDLTILWSGPYAMMMLGALGADVIKVESVQRPDPYRYTWAPFYRDRWFEWAPLWNDSNCDKRDVTLDLTSEAGRGLFERLVRESDIVISNYSNRVMPNLGLTLERLHELNPNLIVVNMPGYGAGGPWQDYVGYAIAFEQLVCGQMTGYADGEPSYCGGFCDPMVGLHVVTAIELALLQRERTGRGTAVEVPQCETLDSLFAPEQIAVQLGAPSPSRRGNKHDWMAPHDAYRVAGNDQWITIAVATDEQFAALANAIGRPDLATDERFGGVAARKANEAALDAAIAEAVAGRDLIELERELQAAGVMACRVAVAHALDEDEGLRHIGFFQELEREPIGVHAFKTWPFRFSGIDASHKRRPPTLGEHNAEVLGGVLGLPEEELARLRGANVIGEEPIGLAQS
jgi:crotonobetainyl-CoA:carnitine CoA-transferase CaiB-like acyl-CoA transferase